MELKKRAEQAVKDAGKASGGQLSEKDEQLVAEIIEQAMQHAIHEATKQSSSAAVACCGPDADMAHKIAEEIKRANTALIANLSAMR